MTKNKALPKNRTTKTKPINAKPTKVEPLQLPEEPNGPKLDKADLLIKAELIKAKPKTKTKTTNNETAMKTDATMKTVPRITAKSNALPRIEPTKVKTPQLPQEHKMLKLNKANTKNAVITNFVI